jgi:pimeloyl-ACP methyl ester carboxylesterase
MMTLVFVHGFMGGSQQWQSQVKELNGYNVVTVDLPGFGKNADLDALNSISEFAAWVLDELTTLNVDRFHLIGHSMGGMVAQEMATQAPERIDRLVLYGTGAAGNLPGRFEPISTSKRRARDDGSQVTARRIAATWFLQSKAAAAYEGCAKIAECSSMQAILAGLDAMSEWNGVAYLPRIQAQTLVIWGDSDRTYTWSQTEQLWQSIPSASLAVIPNCAHAPHLEKPELFNKILSGFLAS